MDQSELISKLNEAHSSWENMLDEVTPSGMLLPGAVGDWTVKDVIAHVTWAVKETVGMLEAKALVGSDLWRLPEEERNAAVFEENKGRELEDVLEESKEAQRRLIEVVQAITEGELLEAEWYAGLPGSWPPWRVVQVNVIDHYQHHSRDIEAWLHLKN